MQREWIYIIGIVAIVVVVVVLYHISRQSPSD